jgi:hypothetical protein
MQVKIVVPYFHTKFNFSSFSTFIKGIHFKAFRFHESKLNLRRGRDPRSGKKSPRIHKTVCNIVGDNYNACLPIRRSYPAAGNYGMFGLDCEMCYTVEGLEVTKVRPFQHLQLCTYRYEIWITKFTPLC